MAETNPFGPRGEHREGQGFTPPNGIAPEAIEAELHKILASTEFAHSERHRRFLRFTVERALQGHADQLKEYVLGVEVFDRGTAFDPRTDSIVRTEATRLRSKLNEYYQTQGRNDRVIIEFRKGSYRPIFLEPERDLSPDSLPNGQKDLPITPEERKRARKFKVWLPLASVVLSGLLVELWWWESSEKPVPRHQRQHLVSTFPGSQRAASFSPDGSMITFINAVDGVSQVWVKNLAQGDPIQITFGELPARYPRWSPHNDRIVFVLGVDMPPAFRSSLSIWSIPPLGGTPRKIIENGSYANWSPDGTQIVFERGDQIWTAKADGTDQSRVEGVPSGDLLLADRMPAFSPDGSHIVFFHSEAGPRGDFWIISSRGGQPRRLTFDVSMGGSPTWAPDGRSIVFSSERAGSMTLWRIPPSGGSPEPVLVSAGEDTDPEISRDGKNLIYTHSRKASILTMLDLRTNKTRELRETREIVAIPQFAPNGNKISFFSHQNEGEIHLFTINTDGSNLTQITRQKGEQNIWPLWSSDGLALYFYQQRPTTSFRKISVNGGQSVEVVPGWTLETQHGAHVDPRGKFVVYARMTKGVHTSTWVRNLESAKEVSLNRPLRRPRWSRDGNFIVGSDYRSSTTRDGDICICPAGSGACQKVTKGYNPVWSVDDSHIYFLRTGKSKDRAALWSVSREGTNERWIADLRPMYPIAHTFDVSPKGEIVYVQLKRGREELWLTDVANP